MTTSRIELGSRTSNHTPTETDQQKRKKGLKRQNRVSTVYSPFKPKLLPDTKIHKN